MWYFSWILGIGVALSFGIINVLWLESRGAWGSGVDGVDAEHDRR
jgi:cytochrome bd-I ubiquinol oxidase subunit X